MTVTAGGQQVLGDLAAGLPGAHHKHPTIRQLLRVAVVVAVELVHLPREKSRRGRDARPLKEPFARTTSLPWSARAALHTGAAIRCAESPNRSTKARGRKTSGSGPLYVSPGSKERDVGRVLLELAPQVLPRPTQGIPPLQHLLLHPVPGEPAAGGQPRLPGPHLQERPRAEAARAGRR